MHDECYIGVCLCDAKEGLFKEGMLGMYGVSYELVRQVAEGAWDVLG